MNIRTTKIRNKITKKYSYFCFFSDENPLMFYHSANTYCEQFDLSHIDNFEPVYTTWDELRKEHKNV